MKISIGIHRIFSALIIFINIRNAWFWNIGGFDLSLPKFNSYNPYCYVQECCNEDWIKFNKNRLMRNLTDRVYGQPLLENAVVAISSHFNPHFPPKKPLTLSFHGMTGTGKNYVSKFITESMFKKGSKSKYVHHFIGTYHFNDKNKIREYRETLPSWLKGNVSNCPKQLFIFDEVDKIIPEVLNLLKPLIDYRDDIEGVSYTQCVFIFLSNTGADVINEHYHELYITEGRSREDLKISDFETFIQRGAFNEQGWFSRADGYFIEMARKVLYSSILGSFIHFARTLGGFHQSDTIKNNLIDHYIPFLPLEEKHVIMCIKDEFRARNVLNPWQEHVDEVMKFIEWGPDSSKLFSKTGCKRIGQKVAVIVEKYYYRYAFDAKEEL